jgi:rhomboid protease GluP
VSDVLSPPRPERAPRRPLARDGVKEAPYVTLALLAVFAAVFTAEMAFPIKPALGFLQPDEHTLAGLGALVRDRVTGQGEAFRVVAAPFLHLDVWQLLLEGVALMFAGQVAERLFGHATTWLVFLAGALAGSLLSVAIDPPGVVTAGAGGGLLALFAACHLNLGSIPEEERRVGRAHLYWGFLPAVVPLISHRQGESLLYAPYAGGAVAGLLAGFLLLAAGRRAARRRSSARPATSAAIGIAAILGAALVVAGLARAARAYPSYVRGVEAAETADRLIPPAELPADDDAVFARAANLAMRYPDDPRAHYMNGYRLEHEKDAAAAEREYRAALAKADILRRNFPGGQVEAGVRVRLASVLLELGRRPDAVEAARPSCTLSAPAEARVTLTAMGLCSGP